VVLEYSLIVSVLGLSSEFEGVEQLARCSIDAGRIMKVAKRQVGAHVHGTFLDAGVGACPAVSSTAAAAAAETRGSRICQCSCVAGADERLCHACASHPPSPPPLPLCAPTHMPLPFPSKGPHCLTPSCPSPPPPSCCCLPLAPRLS
jgi:hypothetical protein